MELRLTQEHQGFYVPQYKTSEGNWSGFHLYKNFNDGTDIKLALLSLCQIDRGNYGMSYKGCGFSNTKHIFFEKRMFAMAFLGLIKGTTSEPEEFKV